MNLTLRLLIAALFCGVILNSRLALGDEASLGPVIDGYGPTYPITDRDVALRPGFVYKAVFDAASNPEPKKINTGLVSVARYLNMHARNGVSPENMELAVVVHGAALKALLTDKAFASRIGGANPNTELIARLHDAGVRFFVCGQSMAFGGYNRDELVERLQVALSAMTMLTVLQTDGYALLP